LTGSLPEAAQYATLIGSYDMDSMALGSQELAVIGIIIGSVLIIPVIINVVICLFLQESFKRIPPEFRKQQPGMIWLLVIPCFSLVWNFFVFPRLSQSFKAYFSSVNRTDVGDCQENIRIAYSVCCVATVIPYLGCLADIGALVLLIIYLIKTNELKNQIPQVLS
jgi:hypothetical protein